MGDKKVSKNHIIFITSYWNWWGYYINSLRKGATLNKAYIFKDSKRKVTKIEAQNFGKNLVPKQQSKEIVDNNLNNIKEKERESESESDLSNDFGLLPIEIINAEINEENFIRKVSKI